MKKILFLIIGFIFISCFSKANNEEKKNQDEDKAVNELMTTSKWEISEYINAFGDINKNDLRMHGFISKATDIKNPFKSDNLFFHFWPNSTSIDVRIDGNKIHKLTERYIGVKTSEGTSVLGITHVFTILDNDLYTSMKMYKNKEEDPVSEERRLSIFNANKVLYESDFIEYLKSNKNFELEIRTSHGGEYIFNINASEFAEIYGKLVSLWNEYGIEYSK